MSYDIVIIDQVRNNFNQIKFYIEKVMIIMKEI